MPNRAAVPSKILKSLHWKVHADRVRKLSCLDRRRGQLIRAVSPSRSLPPPLLYFFLTHHRAVTARYSACIPGFFSSNDSVDACNGLDLTIPSSNGGLSVLSLRVRDLLKSWYYAREYCKASSRWRPMLKYFRMVFADSNNMDAFMISVPEPLCSVFVRWLPRQSSMAFTIIQRVNRRLKV